MGSLPTVEMVGKSGRIVCNASDVSVWEKKGYSVAGEAKQTPKPEKASAPKKAPAKKTAVVKKKKA